MPLITVGKPVKRPKVVKRGCAARKTARSAPPVAARRSAGRRGPCGGSLPGMSAPSIPLFDLRMEDSDLAAVEAVLRSGALSAGPRVEAFEAARSPSTSGPATRSPSPTARRRCTSPTWRPGSAEGDEVIVPFDHLRGDRRLGGLPGRHAGLRRLGLRARLRPARRRRGGQDHQADARGLRDALRRLPGGGGRAAGDLRRQRDRADRGRRARAGQRPARRPMAGTAGPGGLLLLLLEQGAGGGGGRACSARTTTPSPSASGRRATARWTTASTRCGRRSCTPASNACTTTSSAGAQLTAALPRPARRRRRGDRARTPRRAWPAPPAT